MTSDSPRRFAAPIRYAPCALVASLLLASATTAAAQEGPPAYAPYAAPPAPYAPYAPPLPAGKKTSGWSLGVDVNGAYSYGASNGKLGGFGSDFRFGYRLQGGPLFVVPEFTIGAVSFPGFDGAMRAGGGLRAGLDLGVVEPSVYASGGGFLNVWKSGPAVRAGGALDFRIRRTFLLGVHADVDEAWWNVGNNTYLSPALTYVSPGLHVGWVL